MQGPEQPGKKQILKLWGYGRFKIVHGSRQPNDGGSGSGGGGDGDGDEDGDDGDLKHNDDDDGASTGPRPWEKQRTLSHCSSHTFTQKQNQFKEDFFVVLKGVRPLL